MIQHSRLLTMLFLSIASSNVLADSDTRTVQAEFERCESTMDRVKREMLRFEDAIGRLKRTLDGSTTAKDQEIVQSLLKLENRVDYLRGRIDRSAGQRDKIRGDLKAVSGATCPSCITSSVNLYCRNGETLTREIEECLANASVLEDRIGNGRKLPVKPAVQGKSDTSLDSMCKAIAETVAEKKPFLDSCGSDAGKTLWKQCEVNLLRADGLKTAGAIRESEQTLKLVKLLLDKAIMKCGGE